MKRGFVLGVIFGVLVAGCGRGDRVDPLPKSTLYPEVQTRNARSSIEKPLRDPIASLSYRFTDEDEFNIHNPKKCDTRVQRFRNIHELCMNLIDHDFNRQCANQARFKTFVRYCEPYGYRAFDGLECKVGIAAPSDDLTPLAQDSLLCSEQLKRFKFSTAKQFCIGRPIGEIDSQFDSSDQVVNLSSEVQVKVYKSYAAPNQQVSQNSNFKAVFSRSNESFSQEFSGGIEFNFGCAEHRFTNRERIIVACKPIAGCRN